MIGRDPEYTQQIRKACVDIKDEVLEMGPNLRRGVFIRPEFSCREVCAFDKPDCRPGAGGYHGVGSRSLSFYVTIPGRGGVAFYFHAPFITPDYTERSFPLVVGLEEYPTYDHWWSPLGSVDIHLAVPPANEEWMTRIEHACVVAGSEEGCWLDGTTMQTETGLEILLNGGKEAVWSWLAEAWLPEVIERTGVTT